MTNTVNILKQVKKENYDVFSFTEFETSPSTTFHSLFTNHQLPFTSYASFSEKQPRIVSVVSNVCQNLYQTSSFPVHNDGLLFFCLKELTKYFRYFTIVLYYL